MPLTDQETIRITAQGMIRNYGDGASSEAKAIASRYRKDGGGGHDLWQAVAREIEAMEQFHS